MSVDRSRRQLFPLSNHINCYFYDLEVSCLALLGGWAYQIKAQLCAWATTFQAAQSTHVTVHQLTQVVTEL